MTLQLGFYDLVAFQLYFVDTEMRGMVFLNKELHDIVVIQCDMFIM